mmetsp:Transcript_51209/g.76504  ORF Transcript_51209/g.76504 Transcript_51209/m.76504 type:complete len:203 (+) Transcript_51209:926-1534(+)
MQLHYSINDIVSHLTVRCPFASCNKGNARIWIGRNDVIATDWCTWWCVWIGRQWPVSLPCRQDIGSSYLDISRQILLNFIQQPFNFFFGRSIVRACRFFSIRRSYQSMSLPWQKEEKPSIGRVNVQHTNSTGTIVGRQNDMSPSSCRNRCCCICIFQFAQGIRKGTTCKHNGLGHNFKFFSRQIVATFNSNCFLLVVVVVSN